MSIYCTTFDIGDLHKRSCARVKKVGAKMYEQNDSAPCTCGGAPLVYQGSHVLPSKQDKRNGCLMLGAIPGHIRRNGRDAISGDMHPYWPWLRISLFADGNDSLILSRKQAADLRDAISEWLELSTQKEGL